MLRVAPLFFAILSSAAISAIAAPLPPPSELESKSVADLGRAMAQGTLTSEQLTADCLTRIRQCDPQVNAILALNPHALDEARALDEERRLHGPRSALHGIPVIVKDNIDTAEMPTSLGFFGLKNSRPTADAAVIARLRAAGAIILAKTNLSELAAGPTMSSAGGQTRNPRNLAYGAAGSSSGTAAGLAAGYAPLGLGTDTTGSIRWPAATTGTVGFKPTTGLISYAGVLPANPTLDTVGPMARSVADVAVLFAALQGSGPGSLTQAEPARRAEVGRVAPNALQGVRLGFLRRDFTGNDSAVDPVVFAAIARMKAAGATVVEVELPFPLDELNALTEIFYRTESLPSIDGYLARLGSGLPHSLPEILAMSERVTGPTAECRFPNPGRLQGYRDQIAALPLTDPVYLAARDQGRAYLRACLLALVQRQHLDAIVYPTSNQRINALGTPARRGLKGYFGNVGCCMASLAGWPELSVPAGVLSEGLPVGLSFLGPENTDAKLLNLGDAFERSAPMGATLRTRPM